jgi:hypothetical protein
VVGLLVGLLLPPLLVGPSSPPVVVHSASPPDGGAVAQAHTDEAPSITPGTAVLGQLARTQGRRSDERLAWASSSHWQA